MSQEETAMPILTGYSQFNGRHPETGSVHNMLAYQGIRAPHTGQPYTEAFLLGVSGGITFGYFTFDYEGYDPILSLLIRNTFDPLQTMLERLGISQNVKQTSQAAAGEKNLSEALANGRPALVWADLFSLPYNALPAEDKWWDMQPAVVFGLENGTAYLADRSGQPLEVPAGVLMAARARVKKDKFRVVTLDPPDERKLPAAVQQGIWQCIQLYTEKPPKGTRDNFGFAALQKWAGMLTNTRNPQSWERFFSPGPRMFSALAGNAYLPGAYGWIAHWGARPDADRSTYADFLDEAAVVLNKPGLSEAGERFRESGRLWQDLAAALLPEDVPLLAEARRLKDRRHRLFLEQGGSAEQEIRETNARLMELREEARESFPLQADEAARFRAGLAERILRIQDKEKEAIETLRSIMSQ
jgi:hypothetical protein